MLWQARLGLILTLLCSLVACGGGGQGQTPAQATIPPPTLVLTPTPEDTTNARNSQVKMTLRADTQQLTIDWTDTFATESGYTVEVRTAGGTWQIAESLPSGNATGTAYQWQRTIGASSNYRVSAVKSGYSVPLQNAAGQSEIAVELMNVPMTIEIDQATPVHDGVQLSLANAVGVQSVRYYVDLNEVASVSTGPQFISSWDSSTVPDGEHLLLALAQQSTGAIVELRRQIVADNADVAVSLSLSSPWDNFDLLKLSAVATSDVAINSVEFFVNGASVHVATTRGSDGTYTHTLSKLGLPGGNNVFRAVATDTAGLTAAATRELMIDNRPTLTLTSPADGLIVTGTSLHVEGTFADDLPGATLRATLRDVQFLQTSTPGSFSADYSLAGLPPGEYTLIVRATDTQQQQASVQRRIIIASGQLSYDLIATDVLMLLATEQGAVLYLKNNGDVILRKASGAEVRLQIPAGLIFSGWQLSNGYAAMYGHGSNNQYHIYLFDPSGQVTNVSQPFGSLINLHPVLKHPWLIWNTESYGHYEILNLNTQARVTVPRPTGTNYIGNYAYDFVTTPGAEQLLFSASTAGPAPRTDVFSYALATGTTALIGEGNDAQTDNVRLAWRKATAVSRPNLEVLSAPVGNPSAVTTLTSAMTWNWFTLRDGQIVWFEPNGGTSILKVNDGTTTTVISNIASPNTPSVSDGRVTFCENGKLMSWQSGAGKQVVLNSLPTQGAIHDDGIAFFATGSQALSLYRVQLP